MDTSDLNTELDNTAVFSNGSFGNTSQQPPKREEVALKAKTRGSASSATTTSVQTAAVKLENKYVQTAKG